jgi:HEAT repeat protein
MRRRHREADAALRALKIAKSESDRQAALEPLSDFAFSVGIRVDQPPRKQVDAVFAALANVARKDPSAAVRIDAVYALSHWHEPRAARPLLSVFADTSQPAELRGRAAEGIGWILGAERGSKALRTQVADALSLALKDPAVEVRFWAVYALGHLQAKSARPELERLSTTDHEECPGMWSVGDEARDVLSFWDGRGWGAEREKGPESRRISAS